MIVGVTGRIATGKTTVSKLLEAKGFLRIDADAIYLELRGKSKEMMDEIAHRFGSADKTVLMSAISNDETALGDLNDITHKFIVAEMRRILDKETYSDAVLDVPIPVKDGFLDIAEFIIVTDCSVICQIERIMNRDGISRGDAEAKIGLQMPSSDYCTLGDLVIDTEDMCRRDLEKIIKIALEL